MRNILFLLLIFFIHDALGQEFIDGSFMHKNRLREYILYVPLNHDTASSVPLVLNFHGYTSNAGEQIFYGDFKPIADTADFLIVAPEGTRDFSNATHWNVGWGASTVDDLSFTNALLDTLIANYNIDPNRIYSTGMSNGGFMSHMLACELSERITAIASVTGSMTFAKLASCDPQHPTPVMQIHGTGDQVVPYVGQSPWTANIDSIVAYWTSFNQNDSTPIETDLPDIAPNDGSTVTHYQYVNGSSGAKVELYKVFNGGHTWPNNQFITNGTNFDFDASLAIWQFFAQYDLASLSNSTNLENEVAAPVFSLYPNPALSELSVLRSSTKPTHYQVWDTKGKMIQEGRLGQASKISVESLNTGLYFIHIEGRYQRFLKQ